MMKTLTHFKIPVSSIGFALLCAATTLAQTQSVATNGVKYLQPPNLAAYAPGLDAGVDVDVGQSVVVADDFPCTTTGPITDIHIWGSWYNDKVDTNASFILSIWSDVPKTPTSSFSYPGELLWTQTFGPGAYSICPFTNVTEQFDNAALPTPLVPFGYSTNLYHLSFNAFPTNIFVQTGTPNAPTNYWLSVSELQGTLPPNAFLFGWKTSSTHYNDTAIASSIGAPYPIAWNNPLVTTLTRGPVDFAFTVDTTPTNCCPITITNLFTNGMVITWDCGILQAATDAAGPYLDVVGATSPYTNSSTIPPSTFYRTKCN